MKKFKKKKQPVMKAEGSFETSTLSKALLAKSRLTDDTMSKADRE